MIESAAEAQKATADALAQSPNNFQGYFLRTDPYMIFEEINYSALSAVEDGETHHLVGALVDFLICVKKSEYFGVREKEVQEQELAVALYMAAAYLLGSNPGSGRAVADKLLDKLPKGFGAY